ncbi:MAG: hypothetical protein AAF203_05740 [Pseudomonadota bacterium]
MRARSAMILLAFAGLTISCAHKPTLHDTEVVENKIEQKVDKKEIKKDNEIAYTCLVGQDKRTVRLDKKEKRCEVHYQKFGEIAQVAWAESTPSICDRAFNSIRSNIEGSGFKCVDGTEIQMDKKKMEEKKPLETASNTDK